jgi:tRNA A37 methylthiotransferase MiaB
MPISVYIETYGCQMNVADTELMVGLLNGHGYTSARMRSEELWADWVIFSDTPAQEGCWEWSGAWHSDSAPSC